MNSGKIVKREEPPVYHPPPNQEFTVLALYRKTFRGSELLDWADPRRIQEEARLRDKAQTLRQRNRGWIIRLEELTFDVDQGRKP